jgi:MFS family permease
MDMVGGLSRFYIVVRGALGLEHWHSSALLYSMVFAQGFLGYATTSVMGPIVAEIFEGRHYGSIFGIITIALIGGGAAGPWMAGAIHDAQGRALEPDIGANDIGGTVTSRFGPEAGVWVIAETRELGTRFAKMTDEDGRYVV